MRLRLEHQGADVLLVDAGDFSQGDPPVNSDKGASAIRLMNAAGYDLAIPGNHFFRLEELSPILGFGWTYEPETDTIRLTAGE